MEVEAGVAGAVNLHIPPASIRGENFIRAQTFAGNDRHRAAGNLECAECGKRRYLKARQSTEDL